MPIVAVAPQAGRRNLPVDKSRSGTSQRRHAFVHAYMSNGQNATQAAISAGYSKKTAYSQGQRLLKNVEAAGLLAQAAKQVAKRAELNAENALRVANCIMQSDPRRLFHPDGRPRQVHELDEDTAQAVRVEIVDGIVKIGFWPKTEGLMHVMRHLGLYERDNTQRSENLSLQVLLVGAPTNERE
jgi:phage terminase small subunit